jgi:hypothetical protein
LISNLNGNPSLGLNPAYIIPGTPTLFLAWTGFFYANDPDIVTLDSTPNISGCGGSLNGYSPF